MANDINGALLLTSVDEEGLKDELGVASRIHRNGIKAQINKLKSMIIGAQKVCSNNSDEQLRAQRASLEIERQRIQLRRQEEIHEMQLKNQELQLRTERIQLKRQELELKAQEESDRKMALQISKSLNRLNKIEEEKEEIKQPQPAFSSNQVLQKKQIERRFTDSFKKAGHEYKLHGTKNTGEWFHVPYLPWSGRMYRWQCSCGQYGQTFKFVNWKDADRRKPKSCPNA